MASPSGRECDAMTNRWRDRMASTICASSGACRRSGAGVVIAICGRLGVNFVDELLDAILAGDGLIDHEVNLGRALQPEPCADLAAQKRRRAVQRPVARGARLVV